MDSSTAERNHFKASDGFRGIQQSCLDILPLQLRIIRGDLLPRVAFGDAADDDTHRNARARNADIAVMDRGIDFGSLLPLF
jgi:hypothetical protein